MYDPDHQAIDRGCSYVVWASQYTTAAAAAAAIAAAAASVSMQVEQSLVGRH